MFLRKVSFVLFCSVLASPLSGQEPASETKTEMKSSSIEVGQSFLFESKVMKGEREVNVYLPMGYAHKKNDKKYPVLYLIDGGLEQDFHHISGLSQLASINGDFEELIVVGIKTGVRVTELTSKPKDPRYIKTLPQSGKSEVFLRHIVDEIFPMIEEKYRVNDRRAIVGESLAGLFVADVFLKHPETFTDYICVSPSLWWDDQALGKSAAELLKLHKPSSRKLYLTMADEGGTMQAGLDKIVHAIKANKPEGLTWSYVDRRKSESHSTIYHGAAYDALRKLFGLPKLEYGELPWYLIEGAEPPEEDK